MEANTPTHNEVRLTARKRSFRAAVACLALSLAVLAIAAKTLHYSHQSAETRYFSSSVKIVKAGPKEFGASAPVLVAAIPSPRVAIAPPQISRDEIFRAEVPRERAAFLDLQFLRSPPSLN
jgi:hypothetical protein